MIEQPSTHIAGTAPWQVRAKVMGRLTQGYHFFWNLLALTQGRPVWATAVGHLRTLATKTWTLRSRGIMRLNECAVAAK